MTQLGICFPINREECAYEVTLADVQPVQPATGRTLTAFTVHHRSLEDSRRYEVRISAAPGAPPAAGASANNVR
jgi:hypothetical protein